MAFNVKFLKGTAAGFATINPDANTFYYTTDAEGKNDLYLGSLKLSNDADLQAAIARVAQNETDIDAIELQLSKLVGTGADSIQTMITTAVDAAKVELRKEIKANEDAIKAINDETTGILAQAKTYADGKDAAIAAAKKAGDDAQADVDALELTVDALAKTVADNETDIEAKVKAISDDYLTSTDKTALENAIQGHKDAVDAKVNTLVGDDAGKSARTIANEELAAQLLSGKADADFKTLQDLAAWLEDHPEDVATINTNIQNLQRLVGTLPTDATATDIVGYIAEAVKAEKDRAELAEKGLDDRLKVVEGAVGEGGSVATQISNAIAELDAVEKSADVDTGKGLQVEVTEVDGKITKVALTGDFSETYDAKGAASAAQAAAATDATNKANAAQAAAEATAAADATTKASTAETNAKAYADGLAGNYDPAGSAAAAETAAKSHAESKANAAEANAKTYDDNALTWGSFEQVV